MNKADSERLARISQLEKIYNDDLNNNAVDNSSVRRVHAYLREAYPYSEQSRQRKSRGIIFSVLVGLSAGMILGHLCTPPTFNESETSTSLMVSPTFSLNPPTAFLDSHHRLQNGIVNVSDSTITGIVDSEHHTASLYWTMKLKNNTSEVREAAITMELPQGSALSRATLWINGVPQEATFGAKRQVEAAYDHIVVQHRDPLLVKQLGPNKIQILAAPVNPNGGEMQLRIGLTSPLNTVEGKTTLQMPKVLESNLHFDSKQNIHLTSKQPLRGVGQIEESGIYTLKANISADDLKNTKIFAPDFGNKEFATRLTHTNPTAYVVAKQVDGKLVLSRSSSRPDCPIIQDEDLAFRLSNLWAHQEIEWLAEQGNEVGACDLANVYRIVSSVSSAAVLELESDYSSYNLNRNMYRVASAGNSGASASTNNFTGSVSMAGPINPGAVSSSVSGSINPGAVSLSMAGPTASGASTAAASPDTNAFDSAGGASAVPFLQGATNGTIGPQGMDATVIYGVNTAGTVNVGNLAKVELATKIVQIICFVIASFLACELLRKRQTMHGRAFLATSLFAVCLFTAGYYIPLNALAICQLFGLL